MFRSICAPASWQRGGRALALGALSVCGQMACHGAVMTTSDDAPRAPAEMRDGSVVVNAFDGGLVVKRDAANDASTQTSDVGSASCEPLEKTSPQLAELAVRAGTGYFVPPFVADSVACCVHPNAASDATVEHVYLAQTHVFEVGEQTAPKIPVWQAGVPKSKPETAPVPVRMFELVGERDVLVKVDVTSASGADSPDVAVDVSVDGKLVGTVCMAGPSQLPKSAPTGHVNAAAAGQVTDFSVRNANGFSVTLPGGWVKPGLTLRVRAGRAQRTVTEVVVGAPSRLEVVSVDASFFSTGKPITRKVDVAEYFAKLPVSQLRVVDTLAALSFPSLPVYDFDDAGGVHRGVQVLSAQPTTPAPKDGWGFPLIGELLDLNQALHAAHGDYGIWWMSLSPAQGGGLGGGWNGAGDGESHGIFFHELGHGYGLDHANSAFDDGWFRYEGGNVGDTWGYDAIRKRFLPTLVQLNSEAYDSKASTQRRKQDPMQGGSGDQECERSAAGKLTNCDKYTMFSDANVALIRRALQGTEETKSGKVVTTGGRAWYDFDNKSFTKWDFAEKRAKTVDLGIVGDAKVYTLYASISNDTSAAFTQVFAPLRHTGSLPTPYDVRVAAEKAALKAKCYWGCSLAFRATFASGKVHTYAVQKWFAPQVDEQAKSDKSSDWVALNIPDEGELTKVELLQANKANGDNSTWRNAVVDEADTSVRATFVR